MQTACHLKGCPHEYLLVEIKVNLYLKTDRDKDSYHICRIRGKVGASGVMEQVPRMRWSGWSSSKAT